jgi:hypothetical protein
MRAGESPPARLSVRIKPSSSWPDTSVGNCDDDRAGAGSLPSPSRSPERVRPGRDEFATGSWMPISRSVDDATVWELIS